MIACDRFRRSFQPGSEDAEVLAHLRTCDPCLDFAANADPDVMFRALGGSEMIPPGGVDAFVDDVMQQVRVRAAESASEPRGMSWARRLAVAATVTAAVTSATLVYRMDTAPAVAPAKATAHFSPASRANLVTKPIVETYESANATIVEVPSESAADDVKVVMIFDENLPADL